MVIINLVIIVTKPSNSRPSYNFNSRPNYNSNTLSKPTNNNQNKGRTKDGGEDTNITVDLKTIMIIGFTVTIASMYFVIIAEAKELPRPEISKLEYDLKDELIATIMDM